MPVDGPRLELWRAPTDNDRGDMRGSYELGAPEDTRGEGAPGPSSESRWRQRGLDRLVHRVTDFSRDQRAADRPGPFLGRQQRAVRRRRLSLGHRRRSTRPRRGDRAVQWLGLHLAAGRRPVRSARRAAAGDVVRHRAGRVLSRHPAGGPGRPVRGRCRRAQCRVLTTPGDRASRRAALAGDRRRDGSAAPGGDADQPERTPAGLHADPAHAAGTRPGPASARTGREHPVVSVHRRRGARRRVTRLRVRRAAAARALAERPGLRA